MKRKIYAIIGAVVAITVLALSGKMFEDVGCRKEDERGELILF